MPDLIITVSISGSGAYADQITLKSMTFYQKTKLKPYWKLIKSLQTLLLLFSGITGYISAQCPFIQWQITVLMVISLFLTISGTTVLNMVWDRDIDSRMNRTNHRPLPSGEISTSEATVYGTALLLAGLSIGLLLSLPYALVLFSGFFIDFVIYTIWLKRISAWSIVWGGISGGMPVLAGRVMGLGHVDWIGLLLSLAVVLWIPTHIMTFNIRYYKDYEKARIPTFASSYGMQATRVIIALSAITSALAFGLGALLIGLEWGYLRVMITVATILIGYSLYSLLRPNSKVNYHIFKMASFYMVIVMLIIIIGSLA